MLTAGEDEKESVVLSTNSQKSGQWSVKQVVALAEASNGAAQSSRVHHGQRRYLDTIASWVLASASTITSLKTDHPRPRWLLAGSGPAWSRWILAWGAARLLFESTTTELRQGRVGRSPSRIALRSCPNLSLRTAEGALTTLHEAY